MTASERNLRQVTFTPLMGRHRRIGDVPNGEVWVHCASGYRSSIAASLIDQPHRTVVLIDDTYTEAQNLNLTT